MQKHSNKFYILIRFQKSEHQFNIMRWERKRYIFVWRALVRRLRRWRHWRSENFIVLGLSSIWINLFLRNRNRDDFFGEQLNPLLNKASNVWKSRSDGHLHFLQHFQAKFDLREGKLKDSRSQERQPSCFLVCIEKWHSILQSIVRCALESGVKGEDVNRFDGGNRERKNWKQVWWLGSQWCQCFAWRMKDVDGIDLIARSFYILFVLNDVHAFQIEDLQHLWSYSGSISVLAALLVFASDYCNCICVQSTIHTTLNYFAFL